MGRIVGRSLRIQRILDFIDALWCQQFGNCVHLGCVQLDLVVEYDQAQLLAQALEDLIYSLIVVNSLLPIGDGILRYTAVSYAILASRISWMKYWKYMGAPIVPNGIFGGRTVLRDIRILVWPCQPQQLLGSHMCCGQPDYTLHEI